RAAARPPPVTAPRTPPEPDDRSRGARSAGARERQARTPYRRAGPARPPLTQLREEQPRLALGRLRRVRSVHQVRLNLEREIAADRARRRRERVGRPDDLARRGSRLVALEHHGHQPAARDELDAVAEERLLTVLLVVALREVARHLHVLQRDDSQALSL